MRKYLILIVAFAFLSGMLKCTQDKIKVQKEEIARLESNQKVLTSNVERYKTESNKNVASVQALVMTKQELEESLSNLTDQLRDMKVETKRLKTLSETALQSEHNINAKLELIIKEKEDSLGFPLQPDSMYCINYATPYICIEGCADKNGRFDGNIITNDTILQVVHVIPKKFLFIKYGVKAIRQDIKMANPDANIVFSKYIQIK